MSESNNKGDLPNLDHQPSERDVPGTPWYSAGHAGMFFQDAETGPLLLEPVIHVNNMFMEHFVRSRSWSCHSITISHATCCGRCGSAVGRVTA